MSMFIISIRLLELLVAASLSQCIACCRSLGVVRCANSIPVHFCESLSLKIQKLSVLGMVNKTFLLILDMYLGRRNMSG